MSLVLSKGAATPSAAAEKTISTRQIFVYLACYFFLQALLRIFVSDTAELDESEQVILTQGFRWGYGAQPPLYTWLQAAVFAVTGANVIGLALFKMVLLFSTCVFMFLAAKEITADDKSSIVAMVSLLLVPQFVWESQRDLTHSVLAMLAGAATLSIAAHMLKKHCVVGYVVLGVCVGLGVLSKYNYLLFVFSLGVASLTIPAFRPAVLNWRISLSLAVALAITAPHWWWLLGQGGPAAVSSVHVAIQSGAPKFSRMISPITSAAFFLIGLVPVYVLFFGKTVFRRREKTASADFEKLLLRTFIVGLLCGTVMAIVCNTKFQVRWMQPILFAVPIYLILVVRQQLTPAKFRGLVAVCASVAVLVLVVLPATPVAAGITNRPTRLNSPYASLARQLKEKGIKPGVIVAGSRFVGGNLRFFFSESTVVAPEFHGFDRAPGVEWLVIWDATKSQGLPENLQALVSKLRGTNFAGKRTEFVEAPLKYTGKRHMKLGYIVLFQNEL